MSAGSDLRDLRELIRATPAYPSTLHEWCSIPGRGAADLEDCPALAVLTAHVVQEGPWAKREGTLRYFASLSWRELLTALGLPPRPGTLRVLRKLPRDHCRPQTVEALRRLLAARNGRWRHVLPHLPRITRDTVALLRFDPKLVTPGLIRASTESDADEETVTWLLTSIRILRLKLGHAGPWPYRGLGLEKLKLVEGELFARLHPDPTAFPLPPFPGQPGEIEPLCDLHSLARESESQQNCTISLLGQVLEGTAFVYAVLRPERATLSLRREDPLGEWQLHELRGARNAPPATASIARVRAWFSAAKRRSEPGN